MSYLLDTNVCIRYLRNPASPVGLKLIEKGWEGVFVSATTVFELFRGSYGATNPSNEIKRIVEFLKKIRCIPFDKYAAEHAASILNELEQRGAVIGPYDIQIAAVAIVQNLKLVTHNVSEFSRVSHLDIEDWEAQAELPS
jgi:tRNA(fMet)-specific endonuclease VapC